MGDSKSKFTITDKIISLDIDKDGYIGKRVIVVHAAPDDFNPTRDPDSTGNAGARLGCCRIKAPPKIKNKNKDSNNDSNNNNDPYGSNGGSNNGYMGGSNNGGTPVHALGAVALRRPKRSRIRIRTTRTTRSRASRLKRQKKPQRKTQRKQRRKGRQRPEEKSKFLSHPTTLFVSVS